MLEPEIHRWLRDDVGYWAIQAMHGVGRTTAAIFVAEIGVHRFPTARHLCSCLRPTGALLPSDGGARSPTWSPPASCSPLVYYGIRDGRIRCLAEAG